MARRVRRDLEIGSDGRGRLGGRLSTDEGDDPPNDVVGDDVERSGSIDHGERGQDGSEVEILLAPAGKALEIVLALAVEQDGRWRVEHDREIRPPIPAAEDEAVEASIDRTPARRPGDRAGVVIAEE